MDFHHQSLIDTTLKEDLGHGHDITSRTLIPDDLSSTAILRARQDGILAGLDIAVQVFKTVDPALTLTPHAVDSDQVTKGKDILTVTGNTKSILMAERVALNFISHLSGIATETSRYVDAVAHTQTKIVDTRKTLPGLRALQKYAVRMGGGLNHRHGLDDAILIKDNHIAAIGGIQAALDACQKIGHMVKIEIEVDTLDQLQEVLDHGGADIVMLDNMSPAQLKKAVALIGGRLKTEASGGVDFDTVKAIAETGVDYISVGALTHSVKVFDFGLDID